MSKFELAIPPERLDKRVMGKPFMASAVSKEQVAAYLQSLPDMAGNAIFVETVLETLDTCQETKNQEENPAC